MATIIKLVRGGETVETIKLEDHNDLDGLEIVETELGLEEYTDDLKASKILGFDVEVERGIAHFVIELDWDDEEEE